MTGNLLWFVVDLVRLAVIVVVPSVALVDREVFCVSEVGSVSVTVEVANGWTIAVSYWREVLLVGNTFDFHP